MNTKMIAACLIASVVLAPAATFAKEKKEKKDKWKDNLLPKDEKFLSTGRNAYFILEPGYQLVLEGDEDGKHTILTITVLDETKNINGIETRIVEENEKADGKVIEISRNFFAIGADTKNAYYFGEDVDMYKNEKLTDHGGSWHEGEGDAKHGIMIPGEIKVGDKYYQERAPKVALDRGENVSKNEKVKTPAGEFKNCLKVKETTPLEPGTEYKWYAPEVGLVSEGELKLVKYGFVKKAGSSKTKGNIDLAALKALKKSEGVKAIPSIAAAYKNPNISSGEKEALGRIALAFAGADAQANELYHTAISDPAISVDDRKNLLEDLNEVGYENLKNPTEKDLKLMADRLELIKKYREGSDPKVAESFDEAEKDLRNMLAKAKNP